MCTFFVYMRHRLSSKYAQGTESFYHQFNKDGKTMAADFKFLGGVFGHMGSSATYPSP